MSYLYRTAISLAIVASSLGAWAQTDAQRPQKPSAEASGQVDKATKATPAKNKAQQTMAAMDKQMKAMREMHEKMMNAKTPEERNALMAEQMKVMQEGMGMMGGMGMGMGMGAKGGMDADAMKGGMPTDMESRTQMMEKRMDMMQSMMQMMMDRMPAPAAK
ncbi:MAG: hypothetical protein Q8R67_08935 [Rhodoferax sp.]|nr:hypothetical protein [Rhodoferax sp.]MDP3651794.1 hypothetical protein [Rhodoferax sp.]